MDDARARWRTVALLSTAWTWIDGDALAARHFMRLGYEYDDGVPLCAEERRGTTCALRNEVGNGKFLAD